MGPVPEKVSGLAISAGVVRQGRQYPMAPKMEQAGVVLLVWPPSMAVTLRAVAGDVQNRSRRFCVATVHGGHPPDYR